MADREDYRTRLQRKFLSLEDEGYGDFEFATPELDTYLELSVARLYPHLFKRTKAAAQTPVAYGNADLGAVTISQADRVFLVEDATERQPIHQWQVRPGEIIGINVEDHPSVNLYYYDAYALPADDSTDAGIPDVWTPVIVLGAVIEALESRHDTGVRGDPGQIGVHHEVSLIDRLTARYQAAVGDLAMSLPAVSV